MSLFIAAEALLAGGKAALDGAAALLGLAQLAAALSGRFPGLRSTQKRRPQALAALCGAQADVAVVLPAGAPLADGASHGGPFLP